MGKIVLYASVAFSIVCLYGCGQSDRFQVGGDVITDPITGLEWKREDNGADINFKDAMSYCSSQGSGWRLPIGEELRGLYDVSLSTKCGHSDRTCKTSSKFKLTKSVFWVSDGASLSEANVVYLVDGSLKGTAAGDKLSRRALCVRHTTPR